MSILDTLTKREREVVDLIYEGLRNKDIGYRLGISPRTVEIHRANALVKLNIKGLGIAAVVLKIHQLKRDALLVSARNMQKAVASVITEGGLKPETWWDTLIDAQRDLASAIRENS